MFTDEANRPTVSIILTSYNHEKFVGEAVSSILKQTYGDFELIIVDDGSTDRSVETIQSVHDPRIKFLQTSRLGPSQAMNHGVMSAKGEFIALMTSDDRSHCERISRQLEVIKSRGKDTVVFTWVNAIDGIGRRILNEPSICAGKLFNVPNMSRGEILKWFFSKGNFLCGPTVLLSRDNLLSLAQNKQINSPSLFQLQDFHLWIRLLSRYEFYIIEEPLFDFRFHGQNLSHLNPQTQNAEFTEKFLILADIFSEISDEFFYETFFSGDLSRTSQIDRRVDEAALFLKSEHPYQKLIGIQRYYSLTREAATAAALFEFHEIDSRAFRKLLREERIFVGGIRLELWDVINRIRIRVTSKIFSNPISKLKFWLLRYVRRALRAS